MVLCRCPPVDGPKPVVSSAVPPSGREPVLPKLNNCNQSVTFSAGNLFVSCSGFPWGRFVYGILVGSVMVPVSLESLHTGVRDLIDWPTSQATHLHRGNTMDLIVNGVTKQHQSEEITYRDVALFAGKLPELNLTITYRQGNGATGNMCPGDRMALQSNTIFNVTYTGKA